MEPMNDQHPNDPGPENIVQPPPTITTDSAEPLSGDAPGTGNNTGRDAEHGFEHNAGHGFGHNAGHGFGHNAGHGFGRGFGSNGFGGNGLGSSASDLGGKLTDLAQRLRYLRRSRNDKVFGGVAGGLAEVLGVETVVVRIAIVVLSVMTGVGFLAYPLAWLLIAKAPEDHNFASHSERDVSSRNRRGQSSSPQDVGRGSDHRSPQVAKKMESRQLMAVAIVSIGLLSLFNRMGINLNGDVLWPLALIGIGSAVLFSKSTSSQKDRLAANTSGPNGPGASGPNGTRGGGGWPGSGGSGSGGSGSGGSGSGGSGSGGSGSGGSGSVYRDQPSEPLMGSGLGFTSAAWPSTNTADSSVASARLNPYPVHAPAAPGAFATGSSKPSPDDLLDQARREVDALSTHESWLENPIGSPQPSVKTASVRSTKRFSRMILGITLVVGGFFAMAIRSGWFVVGSSIDTMLALALIGVGAVLFLGAWFGRPFGFLNLGVLLFALLAGASFAGAKWGDGVGQRTYQPKSLQELRNRYKLGAGTLQLDLSKLSKADFSKDSRVVDINLGAGAVAVELPTDATTVAVATTTRGGEVTLFGKTNNQTNRTFRIGNKTAKPDLTLNVRAGVGAIEVARAGKLVNLTDLGGGSLSFNFGSDRTDGADATDVSDTADVSDVADPTDAEDSGDNAKVEKTEAARTQKIPPTADTKRQRQDLEIAA
jgi:phage shock protein PspC (stress-responsive transcriptional regulator)